MTLALPVHIVIWNVLWGAVLEKPELYHQEPGQRRRRRKSQARSQRKPFLRAPTPGQPGQGTSYQYQNRYLDLSDTIIVNLNKALYNNWDGNAAQADLLLPDHHDLLVVRLRNKEGNDLRDHPAASRQSFHLKIFNVSVCLYSLYQPVVEPELRR